MGRSQRAGNSLSHESRSWKRSQRSCLSPGFPGEGTRAQKGAVAPSRVPRGTSAPDSLLSFLSSLPGHHHNLFVSLIPRDGWQFIQPPSIKDLRVLKAKLFPETLSCRGEPVPVPGPCRMELFQKVLVASGEKRPMSRA